MGVSITIAPFDQSRKQGPGSVTVAPSKIPAPKTCGLNLLLVKPCFNLSTGGPPRCGPPDFMPYFHIHEKALKRRLLL
jgi:hypothetical protein